MSREPSSDSFRLEPARYAELAVTSNFSFLTGASHPEELVTRAAALGLDAIAITDRNSLAGVVRAYSALKEIKRAATEEGVQIRSHSQIDSSSRRETNTSPPLVLPDTLKLPRLIVGARLVLIDSPVDWIALPTDRAAYERLSQLLTLGKRRAEKGDCQLTFDDLLKAAKGLILIALPQDVNTETGLCEVAKDHIRRLRQEMPGHVFWAQRRAMTAPTRPGSAPAPRRRTPWPRRWSRSAT